ncbi:MAG TPA: hypothetical protein ENI13_00580 [candidate division CPR3 bacterium]|uniref:Uncharacterized protein n=1 Tax=candidate division CPR3 bacterium TaxID=2268181 RepID=A0A7C1SMU1_UNCC3|nr:hypothetical protein [candidate division CPR3 bacterium]
MPKHTLSERLKRFGFKFLRQPQGRFSLQSQGGFGQVSGLHSIDISQQELSGIDQGLFADVQPGSSVRSKEHLSGISGIERIVGRTEQNIRNALRAQEGDSINVAGTTISRSEAQRLLGQDITAQPEQVAREQTETARVSEEETPTPTAQPLG